MSMNKGKATSGGLALLLLAATQVTVATEPTLEHEIAQSDLHEIMIDRISDAVAQMELLLIDQSRSEADLERERQAKALDIAGAAADLQRSVDLILALQPKLALNQNGAPKFTELATRLKQQAGEMESMARQNQYAALKPAQETMKNTCNTCHSIFRGY